MRRQEARGLAQKCLGLLAVGEEETALEALNPLLTTKVPFPILDLVGQILGERAKEEPQKLLAFLDRLVETRARGRYVVAGPGAHRHQRR